VQRPEQMVWKNEKLVLLTGFFSITEKLFLRDSGYEMGVQSETLLWLHVF